MKENTKSLLTAIVIMPELLHKMDSGYGMSRKQIKYLLTMWVLSQTRYHVSKKEMLAISSYFDQNISDKLIRKGYIKQITDMPVQEGQAPAFFELTGKGLAIINTIEENCQQVIAKHSHLEELKYIL